MMNPLRSFRAGIALSFGIAIFVLTIIFSMVVGTAVRTHITEDVHRQMQDLAQKLSIDLDRGMYEHYTDAKITATMLNLDQMLTLEQQQILLEELQAVFPYYSWIGIANANGIVIADTGQMLLGEDVSTRSWFINGIQTPYVGDIHDALSLAEVLHPDDDAHVRLVDIAMPLENDAGDISGVLGIHLNWDWANYVYHTLLSTDLSGANTEFFILNELNEIILGPEGYEGTIPNDFADELTIPQKHSFTAEWDNENYLVGIAHTFGFLDYRGLGWRIVTREPLGEAFALADQLSGMILIVGGILVIAFIGIGWLMASRITEPIDTIVEAIKPIQEGNISANIPILNDNQEISALSTALQEMVTHLRSEIDERKRAEISLKQSEEKFRKMLEKTSQGVVLVNSSGEIVLVNDYVERKFGYSRDELLGQHINLLIPPESYERHERFVYDFINKPIERPMGIKRELVAINRAGTIFPVEISLTPLVLDDELHIMSFLADISERKRLEEQELYSQQLELELEKERELIQIKERFVSLVSHEFRTPLAVIQSSVNMIIDYIDRMPNERIIERLHIASDHIQRMSNMMEDALRFSKTNSGKVELEYEKIDVPEFVDDIIEVMHEIDKDQHEIITRCDEGSLNADRRLLDHVLSNLISNAIKYSPEGSQVLVSATKEDHHWQFIVEDHGIGFSEDDIPKLFEPFYRAPNAKEQTGTGLGLSIVKEYVELHGGTIEVRSQLHEGSCFTVKIPQNEQ